MRYRKKVSKRKSKKMFKRSAGSHRMNKTTVKRGGTRL